MTHLVSSNQTKQANEDTISTVAGVALHVWKLIWRPNMKQRLCEAIVATRVATHKEHLRQHVCVSGSCLRHKITVFFKFCEIHAIRFSSTWKRLFWILKRFFQMVRQLYFHNVFITMWNLFMRIKFFWPIRVRRFFFITLSQNVKYIAEEYSCDCSFTCITLTSRRVNWIILVI